MHRAGLSRRRAIQGNTEQNPGHAARGAERLSPPRALLSTSNDAGTECVAFRGRAAKIKSSECCLLRLLLAYSSGRFQFFKLSISLSMS